MWHFWYWNQYGMRYCSTEISMVIFSYYGVGRRVHHLTQFRDFISYLPYISYKEIDASINLGTCRTHTVQWNDRLLAGFQIGRLQRRIQVHDDVVICEVLKIVGRNQVESVAFLDLVSSVSEGSVSSAAAPYRDEQELVWKKSTIFGWQIVGCRYGQATDSEEVRNVSRLRVFWWLGSIHHVSLARAGRVLGAWEDCGVGIDGLRSDEGGVEQEDDEGEKGCFHFGCKLGRVEPRRSF